MWTCLDLSHDLDMLKVIYFTLISLTVVHFPRLTGYRYFHDKKKNDVESNIFAGLLRPHMCPLSLIFMYHWYKYFTSYRLTLSATMIQIYSHPKNVIYRFL